MKKIEGKLYTEFGEKLLEQMDDRDFVPLSEYPRPQMVRDSYFCLNGWWEYVIEKRSVEGKEKATNADIKQNERSRGRILVPFSPEAPLSTVDITVLPEDRLYYRRSFSLPEGFCKGKVLLHFDAVDYRCIIKVNGQIAGEHKGGYFAFAVDITAYLEAENSLELLVTDPTDTSYIARGKQRSKRGNIWYSPQSGIWQTVWLESVPPQYIESFRMIPDIDNGQITVEIEDNMLSGNSEDKCAGHSDTADCLVGSIVILDRETVVAHGVIERRTAVITFPDFELWSPENPKLYDVVITYGDDIVKSYVGMRKFALGNDRKGIRRLYLNNRPYFHNGVLDQGYYPDGLLTPPSDKAMIGDITAMKNLGFNMIRKHIKVEPLRWYSHCDRIGMIVWQDMVNGGRDRFTQMTVLSFLKVPCKDNRYWFFGRQDKDGREEYEIDAKRTIQHLYNVTSIGMWVPFNESWGQFDGDRIGKWIESMDESRTVDRYSGWFDQGHSDFVSLHIYFRPFKVPHAYMRKKAIRDREKTAMEMETLSLHKQTKCLILTEFGGYSFKEPGHYFITKKDFGYKKFVSKAELSQGYRSLFEKEILPAIPLGLSATVYTQLTDVEDEVNGILTYDRKVVKIDTIKSMNERVCLEFEDACL